MPSPRRRSALPFTVVCLAVGVGLMVATASPAAATEITYLDARTCSRETVRVSEVVSETWTEVRYRTAPNGPVQAIPTHLVLDVRRPDERPDVDTRKLLRAIGRVEAGDVSDAIRDLRAVSGGGYDVDAKGRRQAYRSFKEGDPRRSKRPHWSSEYAHFFLAKALYLEGVAKEDARLLEEAYLALLDQKVPGGKGRSRTGGFLGRFKVGQSRWYAEAMLLKARVLLRLGRAKEAAKAFQDLETRALALDIGPRWAYEARIGQADLAESSGRPDEAVGAAKGASMLLKVLLDNEERPCVRREIGRLHNRARMRAAAVMLSRAEEKPSAASFKSLRSYVKSSVPAAHAKGGVPLASPEEDPILAGAYDPYVQAVAQNCLGSAHLHEEDLDKALLAFHTVAVRYFQDPDWHARALHFLALTAEQAAQRDDGAQGRGLTLVQEWARATLQRLHPNSRWNR